MNLSNEDLQTVKRLSKEPYFWIRKIMPEVKDYEDDLFDLIDKLKGVWEDCSAERIYFSFALTLEEKHDTTQGLTISNYQELQKRQLSANGQLIFEIDLKGQIVSEINLGQELDPRIVTVFSQQRNLIVFWLGPDFSIRCKGVAWDNRDTIEVLRDIKSRRGYRFRPIEDLKEVIQSHFQEYVLDEKRIVYCVDRQR